MAGRLRTLASQSAIYGLGSVAARIVSILLLPLYTRYLQPSDYGRVELVLTFVTALAIVTKLGLINSYFRFHFDSDDPAQQARVFRTVFLTLITMTTLASLAIVALSEPISRYMLAGATDRRLVLMLALGLWTTSNYELQVAVFRVNQRPVPFAISAVCNVTLTILLTLLFVVGLGLGAVGVLAGNFLGTLAIWTFLLVRQRRMLGLTLDRRLLKEMLAFGLPLVPAGAALWAVNLVDKPIVASLAGAGTLGVYAIAYKLAQGVMLLVTAFQLSWPAFAYSIKDDDEARQTYATVLSVYVAFMGWVGLAISLWAPWLVRLLTQPKYYGATDAVAPLALGAGLYGCFYIAAIGVGRAKKNRMNWVITLAAALVEVATLYLIVPRFGIVGAAVSHFLAYLVMFLLMVAHSQRHFPIPWQKLRLMKACGAIALCLAVGLLLPQHGAGALAARSAAIAALPLVLLAAGFFQPAERARIRSTLRLRRARTTDSA